MYIDLIFELIKELKENFKLKRYCYAYDNTGKIYYGMINVVSNTLITKIILGTFGCVPAYDTYFIKGLKRTSMQYHSLSKNSIKELYDLAAKNITEIKQTIVSMPAQKGIYTIMKMIDIYMWEKEYKFM